MASRVLLLVYVLASRGVMVVLEQPTSSLFQMIPRFQQLLSAMTIYRARVCLGYYHGASKKPVYLYSTHDCIHDVHEFAATRRLPKSHDIVSRETRDDGSVAVSGAIVMCPHIAISVHRLKPCSALLRVRCLRSKLETNCATRWNTTL